MLRIVFRICILIILKQPSSERYVPQTKRKVIRSTVQIQWREGCPYCREAVGRRTIEGVQGRHFLPLVPFLKLVLLQGRIRLPS